MRAVPCIRKNIIDRFILNIKESKHVERILNRIENTLNTTFEGLKSMYQEFRIYLNLDPRCMAIESTS